VGGDGFTPTPDERERLNHIDVRLQSLMPPEDYLSIVSGSTSSLSSSTNTVCITLYHFYFIV
jgi:hypothetical protein